VVSEEAGSLEQLPKPRQGIVAAAKAVVNHRTLLAGPQCRDDARAPSAIGKVETRNAKA
jgi:hypothetical protein